MLDPTERLNLLDAGAVVRVGATDARIASRGGTDQRPVIALETVASRESAEGLRGQELTVARSQLGELESGEYLADDLVGLAVTDGDRAVGTVSNVLLLPSADVLEVDRKDTATLLVPMVHDAIRSIDTERRLIDIDLGFLGER